MTSLSPGADKQSGGTTLIGAPLIKTSSHGGAPKSASLMKKTTKFPEKRRLASPKMRKWRGAIHLIDRVVGRQTPTSDVDREMRGKTACCISDVIVKHGMD